MHITSKTEFDGSALQRVKTELCERLWLSVLVLALVLTPISIARALDTGWLPVYTGHLSGSSIMLMTLLLRKRLSVGLRALIAVVLLELTGAGSLLRMGFLGYAALWLAVGAYVIGTLYGMRAGLWAMAAHVVIVGAAMAGYMNGGLQLPVNADTYMQMVWPWLLFAGMMVIFPWMLLNSIGLYRQSIVDLLRETERQRVEIERLATHDPLTGLAQLRLLHERLESTIDRARNSGRSLAVLFIDLDGFKQVNDRFGHAAGDHLLRSVARTLEGLVRDTDTVGRLGGDEFLVVLGDLSGPEVAEVAARRVLQELRRPVIYKDSLLQVGASIGIAMSPDDGTTPEGLQQAADAAMYTVKNSGKYGFAFSGGKTAHIESEHSTADTMRNIRVLRGDFAGL